jgi:hypothetical protein
MGINQQWIVDQQAYPNCEMGKSWINEVSLVLQWIIRSIVFCNWFALMDQTTNNHGGFIIHNGQYHGI